jgi:hypothetical protein
MCDRSQLAGKRQAEKEEIERDVDILVYRTKAAFAADLCAFVLRKRPSAASWLPEIVNEWTERNRSQSAA